MILPSLPGLLGAEHTGSERAVVWMSAMLDFYDRVWTPADLVELPEDLDPRRVEIVDGLLVVSPQPAMPHIEVVDFLHAALIRALPDDMSVSQTAPIGLGHTYRVPDLSVLRRDAYRRAENAISPREFVLAVEIESPSSITTDRITKPAEYARAGIPHYWRIELDPLRLHVYRLAGDVYELSGSWGADETARITDPFEVEFDLRGLVPD